MSAIPENIACKQLVALVTEYLEDALSEHERRLFEEHISVCGHCTEYLQQIKDTIAAAASLPPEPPASAVKDQLMALYRSVIEP